ALSDGCAAGAGRGGRAAPPGAAGCAGRWGGGGWMMHPPRLRPGAVVSLVAAAGPLAEGAVARAAERVRALGWEPRVGRGAEARAGYLAGTDEVRLRDLQ